MTTAAIANEQKLADTGRVSADVPCDGERRTLTCRAER